MDTGTNELLVWQNDAPVVTMNTQQEFTNWKDDTPVEDIDESHGQVVPPVVSGRRRAFIF